MPIPRYPYRALVSALILVIALPLACRKAAEEPTLITTRLSDRTLVLRGSHPLSPRVTAFASDKGLIVFDTMGTPSQAAAVRRRIEREFGRNDFLYVINTHDHWDHWCGNQAFADALIISHASCPAEMQRPLDAASHPAPSLRETVEAWKKALAGSDPASESAEDLRKRIASFQSAYEELGRDFIPILPMLTFTDRLQIDLGKHTLKLYFTGGYETPDDIMAHIPEEGLVILGDTFQRGQYYAAFENGIDVPNWMEILEAVLADKVEFAVPGHGDPLSREELAEIGKYLKITWEGAEAIVDQGPGSDRARKVLSLETLSSLLDPALIDLKGLEAVHRDNVEAFRRRILKTR